MVKLPPSNTHDREADTLIFREPRPSLRVVSRVWTARHAGKRRRAVWLALVFGAILFSIVPSWCAERAATESTLKAVLLLKLMQFSEWPAQAFRTPDEPLMIGIIGKDTFGDALENTLRGERVHQRSLVFKRFEPDDDPSGCQVLLFSSLEKQRVREILGQLKGQSVLTVSELDQFGQQGGVVRLIIEKQGARFEINREAAERANLKLSSKLLGLARIVKTES